MLGIKTIALILYIFEFSASSLPNSEYGEFINRLILLTGIVAVIYIVSYVGVLQKRKWSPMLVVSIVLADLFLQTGLISQFNTIGFELSEFALDEVAKKPSFNLKLIE